MKLRCGVVGLGRGRLFVEVLSGAEGCEVVAVCDPNPATFEPFSGIPAFTRYEEFLDQRLDLVAIISPGPVHAAQSLQALGRGAHVLCETPCVYSIEEARQVVARVRSSGLKYMLAEDYVWTGWCVALQQMAADGEFGDIVYAEGDYTHDCRDRMLADKDGFVPYAERDKHPDARPTWHATSLPPIQYCSHTLGPILRLLGDRVVSAYGLRVAGRLDAGLAPTDLESALMHTRSGTIIRLTNGFTVANPKSFYYNLVGTRGSVKIFRAGGTVARWWTESCGRSAGWQDLPAASDPRPDGRSGVEVMVEEFVDSIRRDCQPPIDVYESMDMTIPGIIAHRSAMEGGVKLDVPDARVDL